MFSEAKVTKMNLTSGKAVAETNLTKPFDTKCTDSVEYTIFLKLQKSNLAFCIQKEDVLNRVGGKQK